MINYRSILLIMIIAVSSSALSAASVTVPSAWNVEGWWVDSGISVTAGDRIHVTSKGTWTTGSYSDTNGSNLSAWDQWLNPNNLGDGRPDGSWTTPVTKHFGALIGYIGPSPLPVGLYGNCSRADKLAYISRMMPLGSDTYATAPATGKLWLGMNDDAYSGNYSDNSGSIIVKIEIIYAFNPSNKHYYQKIAAPNNITWYDARAYTEKLKFHGKTGHLATITSAKEESFIVDKLGDINCYWIGGYQPFGSTEPKGGWRWVTGEPWSYTHWDSPQPDNCNNTENGLQIWTPKVSWNDNTMWFGQPGYIVEYDDWQPNPIYNPANGHYYQTLAIPTGASWYYCKSAAEKLTFKGARGHLATITSADENAFVAALPPLASSYWIGGYELTSSKQPSGEWHWVTGEYWTYTNWDQYEPSNDSDHDGAEMRLTDKWNDRTKMDSSMQGYIVEYEPVNY